VVGAVILLTSAVSIQRTMKREKRARAVSGHHPHLDFTVVLGRPWLDTTNGELVDRVLANNPGSQRLPTPLLWRKREAKELAPARVVKSRNPAKLREPDES
jgi:hypothetical protein